MPLNSNNLGKSAIHAAAAILPTQHPNHPIHAAVAVLPTNPAIPPPAPAHHLPPTRGRGRVVYGTPAPRLKQQSVSR